MRKAIPKSIRQEVYAKYDGHCAYCGCELQYKDMQVDHIESVRHAEHQGEEPNDTIENYMPSCRMCNFYKGSGDIEYLRKRLTDELVRNMRKPFDYRMALKYGLITESIHPIKFYFEEVK